MLFYWHPFDLTLSTQHHCRRLSEIVDCLTGGEVHSPEVSDQALLITLVTTAGYHGSRVLALMFINRDVRNAILSGFRYALARIIFYNRISMQNLTCSFVLPLRFFAQDAACGRQSGPRKQFLPARGNHRKKWWC